MEETGGGRQMKKSRGAHICSAKTSSRSKSSADLSEDGKEDIIKAAWDDELERHLVHAFIAVADKTPNAEGGLKSQQWTAVMVLFNKAADVSFDKKQIQSKWSYMRSKWLIYHSMVNKSGWGWNTVLNCPNVDKSVFDAYAAKNKGAAQF